MAKLLYKPFRMLLTIAAGSRAGRIFRTIWNRVDSEHEAPAPLTESVSARREIAARGVQAATAAMTIAAVERAGARAFRHVTGFWPGESEPAPRTDA